MARESLGIIGFGRFGQLLAALLKDDFSVMVSNRSNKSAMAKKLGVDYVSVPQAAGSSIVIICVPISELERVLTDIRPYVRDGALLMDTCTVKEYPAALMQRIVPRTVDILPTHPLFGPDSLFDLKARQWAFCPGSRLTPGMKRWKSFLEKKGFEIKILDCATHDKIIVFGVNIPHLIGLALGNSSLVKPGGMVSMPNLERLETFRKVAKNDTAQLFLDIHRYNRFSGKIESRFISDMGKILQSVRSKKPRYPASKDN